MVIISTSKFFKDNIIARVHKASAICTCVALIHNFNSILFIICTCVTTLHLCCVKNALVFSLSEVSNFFVFIIMHLIELYLTTHNEVFKSGKTYKQRGYLLDSLNEIVFFTVFQHNKSHPHGGT